LWHNIILFFIFIFLILASQKKKCWCMMRHPASLPNHSPYPTLPYPWKRKRKKGGFVRAGSVATRPWRVCTWSMYVKKLLIPFPKFFFSHHSWPDLTRPNQTWPDLEPGVTLLDLYLLLPHILATGVAKIK
jgi:hypothetical protein